VRIRGRGISPGKARGEALILEEAFSFLGGVDPSTGRLTLEDRTDSVEGKVLVFPRGKGSTVGSYVILDLVRRGKAPAAIVNHLAEPIVATGAVMAGVPMVDGVDIDLLDQGDELIIDADAGTIDIPEVKEVEVVTSILRNRGKALILKRSDQVGSCRGMWAGISGFIEEGEEPLQAALREISEEARIESPSLVASGEVLRIRKGEMSWLVHPFLFESSSREVQTDWEHIDHSWIDPEELTGYDSVPNLDEVFRALGLI